MSRDHDALAKGLLNATPLRETAPGLLVKFELDAAGASHKARAALEVVRSAVAEGKIVPGQTTVIEKTGGNFGIGLMLACARWGVPVQLAVGLSFSPVRRRYLRDLGAELIGIDMLERGASPKEVLQWHLQNSGAQDYYFPDQFNNIACVRAHECSTGPEIALQIAEHWPQVRSLDFVACAGTGAHLTGVARALRRVGFELDVTLVEPHGCDSRGGVFVEHRFEGMSVGVAPPLLDWSLVGRRACVSEAEALAAQRQFARSCGYWVGRTTAACLSVAQGLTAGRPANHKVLVIAYDHGAWTP